MRPVVFYDGGCGLCHRAVRFALGRDREGRLRFAPLGGETFQEVVDPAARATLPDSLVLRTEDGRLLTRTSALAVVLGELPGLWPLLGRLLRRVPRPLRDMVYDAVAKVRRRVFPKPEGACPVVPAGLRERFLP